MGLLAHPNLTHGKGSGSGTDGGGQAHEGSAHAHGGLESHEHGEHHEKTLNIAKLH